MPKPVTALAPMAGVTDLAFRELCASMAGIATTTEMVSAKGLVYGDRKSYRLMRVSEHERHAAVQLFGSEPDILARAAEMAAGLPGVTAIDLNMGCPVPKIVSAGDGCALMRDIPKAAALVGAVVKAVPLPVTVKFRKGWDKGSINCVEFAQAMEQAGASGLCVHGRTRTQMYSGTCDFEAIAAVKRAVSIPVTASGDVGSPEAALRCRLHTGADAVMIGRAAFGDPWTVARVDAALRGLPLPEKPPLPERLETAKAQFRRAAEDKGETVACLEARKHLCWYLHGIPRAASLRTRVMTVETLEDIDRVIEEIVRETR
jgi:tRNA-dihydrouridine synthase B